MEAEQKTRYDGMTTEELQVEWVQLAAMLRRLAAEVEQLGSSATPPEEVRRLAPVVIASYRKLDAEWDYVDDLLLEREAEPRALDQEP